MTLATLVLTLLVTTGAEAGETAQTGPILLDFTASWCGPCQSMKPAVEELHRKGYPIKPIDIDRYPELAERYGITGVPTFVVVERDGKELARQSGACAASDLAALYRRGLAKSERVRAVASDGGRTTVRAQNAAEEDGEDEVEADAELISEARPSSNPWETVVRIKVHNHYSRPASIGFGSGTIIHSTADEAIILTCAHIFHIEELGQRQARPERFPLKVMVDLFDGELRASPTQNRTPYMLPSVKDIPAQVIDYDFAGDVGLIRIKTGGRPLPFAKVVPPGWKPQRGMRLTTLGCSEGRPATAWTTYVTNPKVGIQTPHAGQGGYVGTECAFPPKQGRSGGGLFTLEGLVAGVCDFNDGPTPRNHGLYAAPETIHKMLARNQLQVCWLTDRPGNRPGAAMVAQGDRSRRATPSRTREVARTEPAKVLAQSPDPGDYEPIPIPPPDVLDARLPESAGELAGLEDDAQSTRRYRWRPVPNGRLELAETDVRSPIPSRLAGGSEGFDGARAEDRRGGSDFALFPETDDRGKTLPTPDQRTTTRQSRSAPPARGDHWRAVGPGRR
jgi:thiol-disulfide isomerase/thioredoxin